MKPHKNTKFSHHNVGQPWLKPKEKKIKKLVLLDIESSIGPDAWAMVDNEIHYGSNIKKILTSELKPHPHQLQAFAYVQQDKKLIAELMYGDGYGKSYINHASLVHDTYLVDTKTISAIKLKEITQQMKEIVQKYQITVTLSNQPPVEVSDDYWISKWHNADLVTPAPIVVAKEKLDVDQIKALNHDVKYKFVYSSGEPVYVDWKNGYGVGLPGSLNGQYPARLSSRWTDPELDQQQKDRAKDRLQFMEKEKDSLLIAVPEHVAAERRTGQIVKAMQDFAQSEFAIARIPLEHEINRRTELIRARDQRIQFQREKNEMLEKQLDTVMAELEVLRARKSRIESTQITLGVRPRQFRED